MITPEKIEQRRQMRTAGASQEEVEIALDGSVRVFDTGATRDTDEGKFDYEGFLNPLVLEAFAAYMHKHRTQSDGSMRAGDNWQKGIPMPELMKSLLRHVFTAWRLHRGYCRPGEDDATITEALCGVIFNAQGYLLHLLRHGYGGIHK